MSARETSQALQCRVCGYTRHVYNPGNRVIRRFIPGCPLCGAEMWDINELEKYMRAEGEYQPGGEYWTSRYGPHKEMKEGE